MAGTKFVKRRTTQGDETAELIRFCHDLRQYVSAGLLLSEMPADEALGDEIRDRMGLLHQQFSHIAELIATVSGDLTPRSWPLDLVEIAEECLKVVQLTQRVTVRVKASGSAVGYGDPMLVRRALLNVLDNAARAVGPDGTVTVSVGGDDDSAWVEVADDGIGFGQIASGTGHGLAIVHAAMSASQGRLEIGSGPGPGTQVRMVFPVRVRGEQAS